MAFLVRKIIRNLWVSGDVVPWSPMNIKADTITKDLRTSSNNLSLWRIESLEDMPQAVIALTANFDHLQGIDMVAIDEMDLRSRGLSIGQSPSGTPVVDLRDTHRNVTDLTLEKLSAFALCVFSAVDAGQVRSYSAKQVKGMLNEAISVGRINTNALKPSLLLRP